MNCCQCQGIETMFDEKTARKQLKRYRKKGPAKTTRVLIEALKRKGVDGLSLLDIGGGIGAIQHELMSSGVKTATTVEASTAYIKASREESEGKVGNTKAVYHNGDFVELASRIASADVVTLDKVICCYHNMEDLVRLSAEKAQNYYGVVYPRDTWWMKLAQPILNLIPRIQGNPFRMFIHPTQAVDTIVQKSGLRPYFYQKTFVWQIVAYAR